MKKSKILIANFMDIVPVVYVVLGIDENEFDQVLAVCSSYEGARDYCMDMTCNPEYFDLWIEKHEVI